MYLYLDNAATSFPKPKQVINAVSDYMCNIGANPGRGAHSLSLNANRIILDCRLAIMELFNFDKPDNIVFTSNVTYALNLLIHGAVKKGWHVITSVMEHNSVLRPLTRLKTEGFIELDILPCDKNGIISLENVNDLIKNNTKLIILSHASNVIGSIQPLEEIGKLCKEKAIYFIVDAAQSAGSIPVNFQHLGCDALAFTGHKALLGPQGIGGFLISDRLNAITESLFHGGTGSISESLSQPNFMPDKFESGTLNGPAIAGLKEGIAYIKKLGLDYITEKEKFLTNSFIEGLNNISFINTYVNDINLYRTSVVSITSNSLSNSELEFQLDKQYGIISRSGLHCAPLAHKNLNTFPAGTVRFSFGVFNEIEDVKYLLNTIDKIIKGK